MKDALKSRIPLIAFGLFALVFTIAEYSRVSDFDIFWQASQAFGRGENMYEKVYNVGFRYFYSPLFAFVLQPLAHVSKFLAGSIWNGLGFFFLGRTFYLIFVFFLPDFKDKINRVWVITFLAALFPIYTNFHATQMSAFILYAIVESLYQIQVQKRLFLGAAILALAINFKVLPIVVIPYLIWRNELKSVFYTAGFLVLFCLLPALAVGWDANAELHASWWKQINPMNGENIIDVNEPGLHSLTTLLSTLFTDQVNRFDLPLRRHLFLLSEGAVYWVVNLTRMALVLFFLYFAGIRPFREQKDRLRQFWEVSALVLLIPLLFPHQQKYAFYLLLPAIYYLVFFWVVTPKELRVTKRFRLMKGIGILSLVIINLELVVGEFREYFMHYKTLTYGALLLLFCLTISRPELLRKKI